MAIQTRGFQVGVMPQLPAVDPSLFAFDPSAISRGVLDTFKLSEARNQLQQQQAQMEEQAATQAARIQQVRALSQLQTLAAAKAQAEHEAQIRADLAQFNLQEAQAKGGAEDLPGVRQLEALKRGFQTKQIGSQEQLLPGQTNLAALQNVLGTMDTSDKIASFQEDSELAKRMKKAQASELEAHAKYWLADAERMLAAATGTKPDDASKAYLRKIGTTAAVLGIQPEKIIALNESDARNSNGIKLSSELGELAANLQKPEFFLDPYSKMSPELKAWMGPGALAQISRVDPHVLRATGGNLSPATGAAAPVSTPATTPAAEPDTGGVPKITIDTKGNILRGGKAVKPAPAEGQSASVNNSSANSGVTSAIMPYAIPASLMAPLALRALRGIQLAPVANKVLPALSNVGSVAARIAPGVGAVSAANTGIGQYLSNKYQTPKMGALEGIAAGLTAPSFDQMSQDAHYDELSQRIGMLLQNSTIPDDQKQTELATLLAMRDKLGIEMREP